MKKAFLKARSFLLLSCLALGIAALSAQPAQADWRVSFDGDGPASPQWGFPLGTPMSYVGQNQGLNGLIRHNNTLTRYPSQVGNYDYTVTATLHWEGPGVAPATVNVTESVAAHASFGAALDGPDDYGAAIQFATDVPTANVPSGVTVADSSTSSSRTTSATFTRTWSVDTNGNAILPARRIKSNILFNWAAEPTITPDQYPSSYATGGTYSVDVVSG